MFQSTFDDNHIDILNSYTTVQSHEKTGKIFIEKVKQCILITLMIIYAIFLAIVEIVCLYVHCVIIGYLNTNKMQWAIGFIVAKLIIQFVKGIFVIRKMYIEHQINQKKRY